MANPNNCATCDHKQHHYYYGHCYMFRMTPTEPCAHHTVQVEAIKALRMQQAIRTIERMQKQ